MAAKPGAEAVVNRLAGVLFVQMVRAYIEQSKSPPAMLAAIADRQIGAALALMHKEPAEAWTLETLARSAGMSRSALAARFHQLVGDTPMQYLTMWRMQLARRLLGIAPGHGRDRRASGLSVGSGASARRSRRPWARAGRLSARSRRALNVSTRILIVSPVAQRPLEISRAPPGFSASAASAFSGSRHDGHCRRARGASRGSGSL